MFFGPLSEANLLSRIPSLFLFCKKAKKEPGYRRMRLKSNRNDVLNQARPSQMTGSCVLSWIWFIYQEGQRFNRNTSRAVHKFQKCPLHRRTHSFFFNYKNPEIKVDQTLFCKMNISMFEFMSEDAF